MSELSYTNRDIRALREELVAYAKTLTDDWTDFNESDLGMVFVELIAGTADMLNFYLDKQALETFIGTVKQRKNGKAILDLIGYKFNMTKSCSCPMKVIKQRYDIPNVLIPRYTKVETNATYNGDPINYMTLEDFMIDADEMSFTIPIIEGTLVSTSLAVQNFPSNYKIYLSGNNIAEHSILFKLDGYEWEEVEDVLLDDVEGRKFSIHEDANDMTYIMLHPMYHKYLPVDTTILAYIHYVESLGPEGRIKSNSLTQMKGIVDGYDLSKILAVNNESESSGGAFRESLDLAKKRSKIELYTMKTAVVLTDYSDLAETIPGILHAKAIDWNIEDSKYIKAPYVVDVYLIPENDDYCSDSDIAKVTELLESRKTSTIKLTCKNVKYFDIDIDLKVTTSAPTSQHAGVKADVLNALSNLFSRYNDELTFGSVVSLSKINSVVMNSNRYIEYLDIITPEFNESLEQYEYPRLGSVNIDIVGR